MSEQIVQSKEQQILEAAEQEFWKRVTMEQGQHQ